MPQCLQAAKASGTAAGDSQSEFLYEFQPQVVSSLSHQPQQRSLLPRPAVFRSRNQRLLIPAGASPQAAGLHLLQQLQLLAKAGGTAGVVGTADSWLSSGPLQSRPNSEAAAAAASLLKVAAVEMPDAEWGMALSDRLSSHKVKHFLSTTKEDCRAQCLLTPLAFLFWLFYQR